MGCCIASAKPPPDSSAPMAGQYMSPHEKLMRDTIEFLVALPPDERGRMEEASTVTFTMESQAPAPTGGSWGELLVATVNLGSVEATDLLCQYHLWPAVLNFAHGYNCGGGFEHAGGSQEEDIFRNTSLFLSLWPHRRTDDGPGVLARGMWIGDFDEALARKEAFYPHTECGAVYSPHVRMLRRAAAGPLVAPRDIGDAPTFGVLTVAAQDCGRDPPFRPELLREKVRTTLHTAASNGHDALVLGAFGTGYFRNPPDVVAEVFQELLSGEFASKFKVVLFAVPDQGGARLAAFERKFPPREAREVRESLASLAKPPREISQEEKVMAAAMMAPIV